MTDRTPPSAATGHAPPVHPGQAATLVSGTVANRLGAVFYIAVAAIALAGQTLAAATWLGWPILLALPAVAVLELGGIALAARADFRRRLNETAIASRTLSAAVAVFAVVFNWLGHSDHLQGGFFAGMSALGYAVWLINSGDRRRDQLRAEGRLPAPPPSYETWQWIRHPLVTWQARGLAKATPELGTYGSLAAATHAIRAERRTAAITKVLRRKLRKSVDPTTAEIAVQTYDLDQVAVRLAESADYDGLTALIAADLSPDKLTAATGQVAGTGWPFGRRALSAATPDRPRPVTASVADTHGQATGADSRTDTDAKVLPLDGAATRRRVRPATHTGNSIPTVEQMADTLTREHGAVRVGKPKALDTLRRVYASCSTERALEAKNVHNARHGYGDVVTGTARRESADDTEERAFVRELAHAAG